MIYVSLEDVARECHADLEDVRVVALVELSNDEWDDEMEAVTLDGRDLLVDHFRGGTDPV